MSISEFAEETRDLLGIPEGGFTDFELGDELDELLGTGTSDEDKMRAQRILDEARARARAADEAEAAATPPIAGPMPTSGYGTDQQELAASGDRSLYGIDTYMAGGLASPVRLPPTFIFIVGGALAVGAILGAWLRR